MIIYKTTCLENNKIYIGQDSKDNPEYLGSGKTLLKAIKKYGRQSFAKEVVERCESQEQLDEREIYWIQFFNSTDRNIGYNITEGGNSAGLKFGHEISRKGLYHYWVEKYGQEEADVKWEEKKKKNSEANKRNGTVFNKGIYQHWVDKYGKEEADKRLEAKKEKLREVNRKRKESGWCHSEESRKKIAEAGTGRIHSEETKKKMSEIAKQVDRSYLMKSVLQIDLEGNLVKEWRSISEAAEFFDIHYQQISRVLSGKRKKCKNFIWKYS